MKEIEFAMFLLLVASIRLIFTQDAPPAYIDPNTGGMLFQLLAALFAVMSGFILLFSSRIRQIFYRLRRKVRGSESENEVVDMEEEPSRDDAEQSDQ